MLTDGEQRDLLARFPYQPPHPEQLRVMSALRAGLHSGGVIILESPTGTGKTLMLLTAALSHVQSGGGDSSEPEWIRQHRMNMHKTSDDSGRARKRKSSTTSAVQKLLSLLPESSESDTETVSDFLATTAELRHRRRVVYASRTHSQLAQVVAEFAKLTWVDGRCVTVAGRSHLCINDKVQSRADAAEACADLLQDSQCPYFHPHDTLANMKELVSRLQGANVDIEEAHSRGKECRACPYYAVRSLHQTALLTLLPYPLLLDRVAREAAGIDLTDAIVIIDEAHNLVDAINQQESKLLDHHCLGCVKEAVQRYTDRFGRRLNGVSLSLIQQLLYVLSNLLNYLGAECATGTMEVASFMQSCSIDTINLVRVIEYCRAARLPYKLDYQSSLGARYPLFEVLAFLEKLSEQSINGRILILQQDPHKGPHSSCKYINVNPSAAMQPIVESAHSVVLAGGTMSPMSDLLDTLFPSTAVNCIQFTGHLVPEHRFGVSILSAGPTGHTIDLRHDHRGDEKAWRDVAGIILNMARISPQSMCIFFASYALLQHALTCLQSTMDALRTIKPGGVFVERRGCPVEQLLQDYASAPQACLVAVMGGRLSEGVNLADGLCRMLLLIGLPYPNELDPEVEVRVKAVGSGSKFLHNQCLRRVNQTIGRALRHQHDYAYIVLVDVRYSASAVVSDLPAWLRPQTFVHTFPQAYSGAIAFFKSIKQVVDK